MDGFRGTPTLPFSWGESLYRIFWTAITGPILGPPRRFGGVSWNVSGPTCTRGAMETKPNLTRDFAHGGQFWIGHPAVRFCFMRDRFSRPTHRLQTSLLDTDCSICYSTMCLICLIQWMFSSRLCSGLECHSPYGFPSCLSYG